MNKKTEKDSNRSLEKNLNKKDDLINTNNNKSNKENQINANDNINSKNTKNTKKKNPVILDAETLKKKEAQSKEFESYLNDSGLPIAFQLIYAELISKNILEENYFTYTAMRLRQLGKELNDMKNQA